jgi:regulator of protease activity HflC (stomatin/prohibitin superfamily)
MLWTIAVILLILWLLGFSLHVGGALVHLILVIVVIVVVIRLVLIFHNDSREIVETAGRHVARSRPGFTMTWDPLVRIERTQRVSDGYRNVNPLKSSCHSDATDDQNTQVLDY